MSEKTKSIKIPTPWRIKRYYIYATVTFVALVLPWITIHGNHFFLLSFDKMKLDLAFVQFDMQELYLMPFLLMLMFITIFGMTVVGGRVFCGWVCPQTVFRVIYRDLIETKLLHLRKRIKNKQQEPDMSKPENKVKKIVAIAIWSILAIIAGSDFMWYFVPPQDFFAYLGDFSNHLTMIGFVGGIAAFLIYDIIFLQEGFCVYVCPYSRIQSVLYDDNTVMALYDPHRGGHIYDEEHNKNFTKQKDLKAFEPAAECTTCESCVTVCPTHIDIREGLQLECINCLECVDACTTVMGKLGKPTLVNWSSDYEIIDQKGKTKYFRPKVIGYIAVLIVITILLGYMAGTKEHMLLNVNKETRLYSIRNDGVKTSVENAYKFLLQNTEPKTMKFYFEVLVPKEVDGKKINGKIFIVRPDKPFIAVPDIKKKKIVVLKTNDMLVDNKRKDTIIPIVIHAYALDKNGKPSKIVSVLRNTTFTFPKENLLKSAK